MFSRLQIPLFALLAAGLVAAGLGLGLWTARRLENRTQRLLILIGFPIAGLFLALGIATLIFMVIAILGAEPGGAFL